MNRIPKLAEMLGVEIGESFDIVNNIGEVMKKNCLFNTNRLAEAFDK